MSHGSLRSFASLASLISTACKKSLTLAAFAAIGLAGATASVGCHHDNGVALVPQGSQLVGAGAGRDNIPYQIRVDGTAYVIDPHHDRVVWKGPVHAGDKLTVDGDHNQILLNNDTVSQNDINKRHDYEVYVHP